MQSSSKEARAGSRVFLRLRLAAVRHSRHWRKGGGQQLSRAMVRMAARGPGPQTVRMPSLNFRLRQRHPTFGAARRGMAIVEFLVVALPLFLLGAVVIEVTRWAVARQAISYALFEAARAGAITGADQRAVRLAFERGLIPLLGGGQTDLSRGHDAVRARLATFRTQWAISGYRLVRVRPDPRTESRQADASILVLDLTYLHAPLFPGVGHMLRRVVIPSGDGDPYTDAARRAGLVVLRRDMAMPMQRHPAGNPWDAEGERWKEGDAG
jgi:hypothetical protein